MSPALIVGDAPLFANGEANPAAAVGATTREPRVVPPSRDQRVVNSTSVIFEPKIDRLHATPTALIWAVQVFINGGGVTLSNSVIRNGMHGLRIVDSDPLITNITFLDNEFHAASMDLASNPTITGVVADGNRWNALLVDTGELPADAVWDDPQPRMSI